MQKSSTLIPLPPPRSESGKTLEQALKERRSIRRLAAEPLTLAEVTQLLWAAQGVTDRNGYRTAPSAGALFPLELYVAAGGSADLPAGIYKYLPGNHQLLRTVDGDRRAELAAAALQQPCVKHNGAVVIFAAVAVRTTRKYGQRGIRYIHLEVGHAAQNLQLQAVSLDLGSVAVGAFDDALVARIVGMPPDEEALYLIPVGHQ